MTLFITFIVVFIIMFILDYLSKKYVMKRVPKISWKYIGILIIQSLVITYLLKSLQFNPYL
jgi:hypothetical protein